MAVSSCRVNHVAISPLHRGGRPLPRTGRPFAPLSGSFPHPPAARCTTFSQFFLLPSHQPVAAVAAAPDCGLKALPAAVAAVGSKGYRMAVISCVTSPVVSVSEMCVEGNPRVWYWRRAKAVISRL